MFHEIEKPTVILSSVYHKHYGVLENIDMDSFSCTFNMNSAQEISFDVYKELDGHQCSLWEKLISFKYVYIPQHHEYYKIDVTLDIDNKTVKHITGTSAGEYELSQRKIQGMEINTANDLTYYEVWDENLQKYREIDTNNEKTQPTQFYNADEPKKSMLNRALDERAPDWSIAYVDEILCDKVREFSVSNQTVYDFFTNTLANELDCLFKFDSVNRTISVYDLLNHCTNPDCMKRGEFTDVCPECGCTTIARGYGNDTHIYISANNYANKITVDGDESSVKNCFKISGGDDLMTATVVNCNPSGSEYIYRFSDADYDDMPEELVEKLRQYFELSDELENGEKKEGSFRVTNHTATVTCGFRPYKVIVDAYPYHSEYIEGEGSSGDAGTITVTDDGFTFSTRMIGFNYTYSANSEPYDELTKRYYDALTSYYFYKTSMMPRLGYDHWEANHVYAEHDRCYVITLPSWCYLECVEVRGSGVDRGKSGSKEFDATNVKENDLIVDGNVTWKVVKHIVSLPTAAQTLEDIKAFVQTPVVYYEDKFPEAITSINRYVKSLITSEINPLYKIEILNDADNTWTLDSGSTTRGTLQFNIKVTNTTDTDDNAVNTVQHGDVWVYEPLSVVCEIASSREAHEEYMLQLVRKQLDRQDTTFTNLWEIEYLESEDDCTFYGNSETSVPVSFDADGVLDYVRVDITFADFPAFGTIASSIYDATESTTSSIWKWNTENEVFKDPVVLQIIKSLLPNAVFEEPVEMPFNDPNSIGIVNIDNSGGNTTFVYRTNSGIDLSGHYVARSDEDFRRLLRQYSLDMLNGFAQSYGGCIDTLLENGISSDSEKRYFHGVDLYNDIYMPYNVRLGLIDEEIAVREQTVKYYYNDPDYQPPGDTIPVGGELEYDPNMDEGLVQKYYKQMKAIQKQLDLKEFLRDDEAEEPYWMWYVLYNYLRDGEYQNSNYISDGLSNNVLVQYASELLDKARLELEKASELQYTLSDDLANLLNTEDFAPFKDKFTLGDYIVCGVGDYQNDNFDIDDHNYKLRLISLSYQYGNSQNVSVTFANATKITSYFSDVKDILSQAKSMGSSYPAVTHQVEKNTETTNQVSSWNADGLNSSLTRIKNNYQEEVSYGQDGIIVRSYDYDYSEDKDNPIYGDEQLRITHNILAFTDDNWKTATLGLGKQDYVYYDIEGNKTNGTGYGLISKFVDSGYIHGTQIVGGDIYSEETYTPTGAATSKAVSHFDLNKGTFDLAKGNLVYDGETLSIAANISILGGDLTVKDAGNHILFQADTGDLTATPPVSGSVTIGTFNVKAETINNKTIGAIFSGTNSISDSTHDGIYLGTNGIRNQGGTNHDKYVQITDGKLTANDASITGTITASSGKIGNWDIDSDGLHYRYNDYGFSRLDVGYLGISGNIDSLSHKQFYMDFSPNGGEKFQLGAYEYTSSGEYRWTDKYVTLDATGTLWCGDLIVGTGDPQSADGTPISEAFNQTTFVTVSSDVYEFDASDRDISGNSHKAITKTFTVPTGYTARAAILTKTGSNRVYCYSCFLSASNTVQFSLRLVDNGTLNSSSSARCEAIVICTK